MLFLCGLSTVHNLFVKIVWIFESLSLPADMVETPYCHCLWPLSLLLMHIFIGSAMKKKAMKKVFCDWQKNLDNIRLSTSGTKFQRHSDWFKVCTVRKLAYSVNADRIWNCPVYFSFGFLKHSLMLFQWKQLGVYSAMGYSEWAAHPSVEHWFKNRQTDRKGLVVTLTEVERRWSVAARLSVGDQVDLTLSLLLQQPVLDAVVTTHTVTGQDEDNSTQQPDPYLINK